MLLKIRHALLEVSNSPSTKQSAVIINKEIIISSGSILENYINPLNEDEVAASTCPSTKIISSLQQCRIVNAQDEKCEAGKLLRSLNYVVTFDRRKLSERTAQRNAANASRQSHILTRHNAQPLYVFCCAEVSRNMHKILLAADSQNAKQVLRSSFVVLSMRPTAERENFNRFLEHMGHYLRYLQTIFTLDDVLVMCSPFGLENFYKTISIGKVSNVIGRGGSLFVLSNTLPRGCEGAAVFNNKLRLIGIIICTSFQRQQENVNLSLAANFGHMLRDFMEQLGIPITTFNLGREPSNFAWERTIVVIESSGQQGTGTFIKVHNKRFILTCAHVVGKANACRAVDREFTSEVLWRNPEESRPYDLALLTAPEDIPERYCVRLARNKATYDFNPSIFQGRIIKCDHGAIMSDGSVQAGQSGGPMYDQNGCILGVCVSNISFDDIIYPNINTAIPIWDIRSTLEEFAKTNDLEVLNNLIANEDVHKVWSLEVPFISSKL